MPTGHWTVKKRRDCVDSFEDFYWLSLNPKQCKADNRKVLVDYSKAQQRYIDSAKRKSGVTIRPSGQCANEEAFYADQGGAIPSNLLFATPEGANSEYSRYCLDNGLPRHPAMYHYSLPEFFIKFLTSHGDVIADTCLGSANTGYAAEINDRHWVGAEITKEYLDGSIGRFKNHNVRKFH